MTAEMETVGQIVHCTKAGIPLSYLLYCLLLNTFWNVV